MYGGYYGYGYYWDPTYFLVLVGLVLCLGASALVNCANTAKSGI